ncbi:MAG: hypothetical protein ABI045_02115 [Flavobacteriales bacterium]
MSYPEPDISAESGVKSFRDAGRLLGRAQCDGGGIHPRVDMVEESSVGAIFLQHMPPATQAYGR